MRTLKAKRKKIKALIAELKNLVRERIRLQSPTPEVKEIPALAPPPELIPEMPLSVNLLDPGQRPSKLEGWSKLDIEVAYWDHDFDDDEEVLKWCRKRF